MPAVDVYKRQLLLNLRCSFFQRDNGPNHSVLTFSYLTFIRFYTKNFHCQMSFSSNAGYLLFRKKMMKKNSRLNVPYRYGYG